MEARQRVTERRVILRMIKARYRTYIEEVTTDNDKDLYSATVLTNPCPEQAHEITSNGNSSPVCAV